MTLASVARTLTAITDAITRPHPKKDAPVELKLWNELTPSEKADVFYANADHGPLTDAHVEAVIAAREPSDDPAVPSAEWGAMMDQRINDKRDR